MPIYTSYTSIIEMDCKGKFRVKDTKRDRDREGERERIQIENIAIHQMVYLN